MSKASRELSDKINKAAGSGFRYRGGFTAPRPKLKTKGAVDDTGVRAKFKKANAYALELLKAELTTRLDAAMSYSWGEMGDIIDTGELRDSLQIVISGIRIDINYNSPYANLIHYGGYVQPYGNLNIDKVYIPGRPWVTSVLSGEGPGGPIDLRGIYQEALAQTFK